MIDSGLSPGAETRFNSYLDQIGGLLPDKRQRASFAMYAAGLMSDGARKSMEPMAARLTGDPIRVGATYHKMIHFLATPAWEDAPVRDMAAHYAVEEMERHEPITTWIIDDTGFLKQGTHSPGVQRQYTGSAGKTTNCQIGVSLILANSHSEVTVDFKLYIPESWADDPERCRKAHIPDDVEYVPKWKLAWDMLKTAVDSDLPRGVVLTDSAYGNIAEFRKQLTSHGLLYAVDVKSNRLVRRVLSGGTLGMPMTVMQLGRRLKSKFRKCTWREGSKTSLNSRFVRVRVVVGRKNQSPESSEWLLLEWPEGADGPDHFVLSTLPKRTSLKKMVRIVKNRWRVERSYQDLKGQLGLDHYEGRSFIGWHHHVTVALTCYAFLVAECARSFPNRVPGRVTTVRSPTRPERHFRDSLITMRIALARVVLIRWLSRCPCCLRSGTSPHLPNTS
jgi:SRSO17 transposase